LPLLNKPTSFKTSKSYINRLIELGSKQIVLILCSSASN